MVISFFKVDFGVQRLSHLWRFLEPRGRHQAFRVPGCDHRRLLLLLLLLSAQHSGPVSGDRCWQPQEKPSVGHREPAAVRQCAGRSGGGPERWCHQASGSVSHEPALEFLSSFGIIFLCLPLKTSWVNIADIKELVLYSMQCLKK